MSRLRRLLFHPVDRYLIRRCQHLRRPRESKCRSCLKWTRRCARVMSLHRVVLSATGSPGVWMKRPPTGFAQASARPIHAPALINDRNPRPVCHHGSLYLRRFLSYSGSELSLTIEAENVNARIVRGSVGKISARSGGGGSTHNARAAAQALLCQGGRRRIA